MIRSTMPLSRTPTTPHPDVVDLITPWGRVLPHTSKPCGECGETIVFEVVKVWREFKNSERIWSEARHEFVTHEWRSDISIQCAKCMEPHEKYRSQKKQTLGTFDAGTGEFVMETEWQMIDAPSGMKGFDYEAFHLQSEKRSTPVEKGPTLIMPAKFDCSGEPQEYPFNGFLHNHILPIGTPAFGCGVCYQARPIEAGHPSPCCKTWEYAILTSLGDGRYILGWDED